MSKILPFLVVCLFLFNVVKRSGGRVLIVPHEILTICTKEITKSNNNTDVFDFSNFQIHLENDTHTFINGTVLLNIDVEKVPGRLFMEHFDRGQWTVRLFDRHYKDICVGLHDPLEPGFQYSKDFPYCPMKKSTVFKFDMVPIIFPEHVLEGVPPHLWGQWRASITYEFWSNGEKIDYCTRMHADVHYDPTPRDQLASINPFTG